MHKKRFSGFTLIELLVVIAIIGVLSAVVLASLNSARSKGNDAAIKSNLDSIRSQAAIFIDGPAGSGNYYSAGNVASEDPAAATCKSAAGLSTVLGDANVKAAISSADKAASGDGTPSVALCSHNGANGRVTLWLVAVPLPNAGGYWCVDAVGNSNRIANAPGAGIYTCPAS